MKLKKYIFWALFIIWMGIIFKFSSQPSKESLESSSFLTEILLKFFYPEFSSSEPQTQMLMIESCQNIVRKTAHIAEYAILGFLGLGACLSTFKRKNFWISLGICVLFATTDEIHQLFVPGRAGMVSDVLIDSLGAFLGIVFYIISSDKIAFLRKNEVNYDKT